MQTNLGAIDTTFRISWGTFARDLPDSWQWAQCNLDGIIVGAVGTAALMVVAGIFAMINRKQGIRT